MVAYFHNSTQPASQEERNGCRTIGSVSSSCSPIYCQLRFGHPLIRKVQPNRRTNASFRRVGSYAAIQPCQCLISITLCDKNTPTPTHTRRTRQQERTSGIVPQRGSVASVRRPLCQYLCSLRVHNTNPINTSTANLRICAGEYT